ncbi:MAG: TonB-dependent siderophore receptor [Corticimicrobacter sp.]|uniref:TonB-dependent siderophore receptor n=1 Tax=Corticimicrobacter sp. TaxID=2678536 RepID=UPI0032DAC3C6
MPNERKSHPRHRVSGLSLAIQAALAGLLAMGSTLVHENAHAQAGMAGPPVASDGQAVRSGPQHYDLPAGALADALARFARAAGITLSFDPALVAGQHAPALNGTYGTDQALAELMRDSPVEAVRTGARGYSLRSRPMPTQRLETVTVRGATDSTTEGSGSYTASGPTTAATGLDLTLRQTPQSVTIMTRQRMDDFKLENLTDVMTQTPGVSVTRMGSYIEYGARGSAVNLQTEGSRQNSSGYTYFGGTNYTQDDLADIDRVEVLKGSAGLLTGYGNPGATVNMIRKRPTHDFQASGSVSAGQWDNYRASVDVSGPLNQAATLRGRAVALASRAHGFMDGEKTDGHLLFGTLEADLGESTTLAAGVTYRKRKVSGLAMYESITLYDSAGNFQGWKPRSFNPGARWAGYDQTSINVFSRLEHRFANGWSAKLQASHENIEMPELRLGGYQDSYANATRYLDTLNDNTSLMFDLKGPVEFLGRTHELLVGAGTSEMHSSFGSNKFGDSDHRKKQHYAYGAGRFSLLDPLNLILGMRVTDYESTDKTLYVEGGSQTLKDTGVLTPYAGLVFDASEDISLYASYARIFESQSAQDASGNTLDPREGVTYEIGAKGEFFDKRLNASTSQFWMRTDNEAESTGQKTPGGANAYRAVSGVMRRGYELELSGEVWPGWQLQGSYVMNSSTLSTASSSPKRQLKLGTSYRFAGGSLDDLTVGAAARWQSAREAHAGNIGIEQSPYWVMDLMARYQVNRQLSLSANVNNVFDKKYLAGMSASSWEGVVYTWGAPRSVMLSARYQF